MGDRAAEGANQTMASIALTAPQRAELDGQGWTLCERVLTGEALGRVSDAMDEVAARKRALDGAAAGAVPGVSWRNGLARHPHLLDLIDHEPVLARVVDTIGWNIHNRDSIFIYSTAAFTPRQTASGLNLPATEQDNREGSESQQLHLGWHFDYECVYFNLSQFSLGLTFWSNSRSNVWQRGVLGHDTGRPHAAARFESELADLRPHGPQLRHDAARTGQLQVGCRAACHVAAVARPRRDRAGPRTTWVGLALQVHTRNLRRFVGSV